VPCECRAAKNEPPACFFAYVAAAFRPAAFVFSLVPRLCFRLSSRTRPHRGRDGMRDPLPTSFSFLFELPHSRAGPKLQKNPRPCKNRNDAPPSVVWLWREVTSCAVRMPRFEGCATRRPRFVLTSLNSSRAWRPRSRSRRS